MAPLCRQVKRRLAPEVPHATLEDPVTAQDGFSYERKAIEMWFARNGSAWMMPATSPKTSQTLPSKVLVPNLTLRTLINDWRTAHPDYDRP